MTLGDKDTVRTLASFAFQNSPFKLHGQATRPSPLVAQTKTAVCERVGAILVASWQTTGTRRSI